MATVRTPSNPMKTDQRGQDKTPEKPVVGPSTSSVRRSIGEWETTVKPTQKVKAPTRSPTIKIMETLTPTNRIQEARNQLQIGKRHLTESRNLKTEIKEAVSRAIDRLYQLVKESEDERTKSNRITKQDNDGGRKETGKEIGTNERENAMIERMEKMMEETDRRRKEQELRQKEHMDKMDELKRTLDEHQKTLKGVTYANVVSGKAERNTPAGETLHSIIVTAKDETETGEQIIERVRKAVKAKEGGVEIDRIRKTKDRKVLISCSTKEARRGVKESLEVEEGGLHVEEVRNRDPLLVLKDVLVANTDEDIIRALRNQNGDLFRDLDEENQTLSIKYRKRARNPHLTHVVLTVSPQIWRRAIANGIIHLDIQRVRVEDQSPLIQCSVCLGYGHSRKYCKEQQEKCSHCGGAHMRAQCEEVQIGTPPSCINCNKAGMKNTHHNAFDTDCQIRKKWDALARARVAYC